MGRGPEPVAGRQAIVVAGGRATRLGGIDKCALEADGTSLLDRALLAAGPARAVVVVGRGTREPHLDPVGLRHVDESPRFGGPVAAIAAGLAALDGEPWTLVLAGDLPAVGSAVPLLLSAFAGPRFPGAVDGVVATDAGGRVQPLLGLYRTDALERALRALPSVDGASMRSLLSPLVLAAISVPDAFCADVDTPEDALHFGLSLPDTGAAGSAPDVPPVAEAARVA
jgi:molybdopterin-guanine dinucleotide biosynthesis protein A